MRSTRAGVAAEPARQGRARRQRPGAPKKPPGAFSQFMEKILDEARKDPTYRKMIDEAGRQGRKTGKPDSDDRRDRDRASPGPGRGGNEAALRGRM